eukprot:756079-Pelagomonas_calceolata.AAC.6
MPSTCSKQRGGFMHRGFMLGKHLTDEACSVISCEGLQSLKGGNCWATPAGKGSAGHMDTLVLQIPKGTWLPHHLRRPWDPLRSIDEKHEGSGQIDTATQKHIML